MADLWSTRIDMARFNRNVEAARTSLQTDVKKVVDKTAADFEKTIRRNVPKHPLAPHIGDTVRTEPGDPAKIEKVVRIGNAAAPYGAPLEYGHVDKNGNFVHGARFWTPAKKIFNKRFRSRVKSAVRRAFKRFT
jgi:hypothetical protein